VVVRLVGVVVVVIVIVINDLLVVLSGLYFASVAFLAKGEVEVVAFDAHPILRIVSRALFIALRRPTV
jgi:hypothetical protein